MHKSMMDIHTVTVLGANGSMGRNIAAIFASFGNAKVYLVSRNIEKSIEAKNKAYLSVRAESIKEKMIPSDYTHLEECVKISDVIFEACAEEWNVKADIHRKIADAIGDNGEGKVFCSGTSGLSITKLAELYPSNYRHQFMGIHMFNPPYQMTLCEMIPTIYTENDRSVFESMKKYANKILYRTVVETLDSPAFLGNRIGFYFINNALQMAERFKYSGGIDYIDSILGPFTGRSMPPLITSNFVGLDVHKAIIENLYNNINDYAHDDFALPQFMNVLIDEGKVGKKAGVGLYKTILHENGMKIHQVYDIAHGHYREQIQYAFPFAKDMISFLRVGDYAKAIYVLIENQSIEARLCCEFLLKYIIYSLAKAKELGCDPSAADDVMAAGFHWCPPLALLDAIGSVTDFEKLCEERLEEKIVFAMKNLSLLKEAPKSHYDYRRFMIAK